ncbi:MAG: hypothetical protein HY451_01805 [Parcubacteria group bacterium]|nr:hypothetical protein [Parcubacteria group bacterium]
MELPKTGPAPLTSPPAVRKKFALSPKILILALVIIAAVFAGAWWLMNRESEPTAVITPTPAPTPKPTPKALSQLVSSASQITISSTENFLTALNSAVNSLALTAGGLTLLNLVDENGSIYTLSDFIAQLNISATGILDSLDPSDAALLLYGQQEMFDDKGLLSFNQTPKARIVLVARSISPISTRNALNNWEVTMAADLKNLFGLDPKKATSQTFLDNIYSGTDIRYQNFPFADSTIDYALVNLAKFNVDYFILAGSRESVYSAIDLLKNQ